MDSDQLLIVPHNREAEQRVIGALLIDNNAIDRIGELPEQAFFNRAHQMIYRAIRRQSANSQAWDVITVAEMLDADKKLDEVGGFSYLGELAAQTPTSANVASYADIVRDNHARRMIMAAAADLTSLAAHKGDIHAALDRAQAKLMEIGQSSATDDPRSIGDILPAHLEAVENRQTSGSKAISTGLIDLDAKLNGGYHRGQVIVVAARPSMGKTALALMNARTAAEDRAKVLFLSMEMTAEELSDRLLASTAHIDFSNLLTGKLTEDEWARIADQSGRIQDMPLFIEEKSGLNFYQVATYARRQKRKHGLDLLILDYLQLMAGTDEDERRHAQIEEITRGIKSLAKELNCAVVLLSQLNRKTEQTRRPQLSHLRDSGSVEQDADVVIFIHREEVDNPETNWKNYADIYIAKQRNGPLGRIGATYYGHQVRFENYSGNLPDWSSRAHHRDDNL